MKECVRQVPLVGEQQQPFAQKIQPAHMKEMPRFGRDEFVDGRSTSRIFTRARITGGFVEREPFDGQQFDHDAVDFDTLVFPVDLRAWLGDELSVDTNASAGNDVLALSA